MKVHLKPETHFAFISSDYVFDGDNPPYGEDSARGPVNFYGMSKMMGEDTVATFSRGLILRVPVLVGAGPDLEESGFISRILGALEAGDEIELEDRTVRFPTWNEDVADAVAFLIDREVTGPMHYSGERGETVYQWVRSIGEILGRDVAHLAPADGDPARKARRPRDAHLCTDRIRSLGYSRFTDFAEVFRTVIDRFSRSSS